MNIILSMTLSGSIVFLVYSFFERIRIVYISPWYRYFIIKAILFFHFVPVGYLSRRFAEVFLPDIGRIYRHTFVNGSKPAVIFAPNERYINAAYENHRAIIGIWLFISVCLFLRAVYVRCKLRNLIMHLSGEVISGTAWEFLCEWQRRLGIRGKIRLYTTNADISAFTYGLFQPIIVVPATYAGKELELSILHELIHIKKKDSLILFLRTLTVGIYWFNPLIYFIYRKTGVLCELSCDELVIRHIREEDRRSYSELIIEAAGGHYLTSSHITPFSKNQRIIKERIDFIMSKRKNRFRLAPVVLSAGILLTSTFPVLAYEPPKKVLVLDDVQEDKMSIVSPDNFIEFTTNGYSAQTVERPDCHIQYDFQFTDKNGNVYPADRPAGQASCNHTFMNGTYTTHIKNDDGSCILRDYDAKRCSKCGAITDRQLRSTTEYVKCPH